MSDRPKFEIDERKRVEGGQNAYKGKECENNSFVKEWELVYEGMLHCY